MYTYIHNIVCKSEIYTYYMCVYVCEREREGGTDVFLPWSAYGGQRTVWIVSQCLSSVFSEAINLLLEDLAHELSRILCLCFPFLHKSMQLQACPSVPSLVFLLRWGLRSLSCQLAGLGISPTPVAILNVSIIQNFYHSYSEK